VANLLNTAWLL